MIINEDEKWLYVSVPKAGTMSMYKVLPEEFGGVRIGGGHDNKVDKYVDPEDYFVWTIVRNPYARMVSLWWRTCVDTRDRDDPYKTQKKIGDSGGGSFGSFLNWISNHEPSHFEEHRKNHMSIMFQPQWYWLRNIDIHTIPLENLNFYFRSLPFVNGDFNLKTHENKSKDKPRWNDPEFMKEEYIWMINRYCENSFDRFGYPKYNTMKNTDVDSSSQNIEDTFDEETVFCFDRDQTTRCMDKNCNLPHDHDSKYFMPEGLVPTNVVQHIVNLGCEVFATGNQKLLYEVDGMHSIGDIMNMAPEGAMDDVNFLNAGIPHRADRPRIVKKIFPNKNRYIVVDDIDLSILEDEGWEYYHPKHFVREFLYEK